MAVHWVQQEIGGVHFGGVPSFRVEIIKSGLPIIIDSLGHNAMGFSKVSNKGAFVYAGDNNIIIEKLNRK